MGDNWRKFWISKKKVHLKPTTKIYIKEEEIEREVA